MTNRDTTIDRVFQRLADAPRAVDCTIDQVLVAAGMLVSAILAETFADPSARQTKADWFIRGLQRCVNRTNARAEPTLN